VQPVHTPAKALPGEIGSTKATPMTARSPSADGLATDATPVFAWPVHGKILSHFGSRANGEKGDGIDIAVPEDTPIQAAEDGVVIYAGSGLKQFGNLVLVRHPNNYVTVYAHAKELNVARGDYVKRGDLIAKSGRTGYASTPQLYFEVRKDNAAVNPLRFLPGKASQTTRNRLDSLKPRRNDSNVARTESQN